MASRSRSSSARRPTPATASAGTPMDPCFRRSSTPRRSAPSGVAARCGGSEPSFLVRIWLGSSRRGGNKPPVDTSVGLVLVGSGKVWPGRDRPPPSRGREPVAGIFLHPAFPHGGDLASAGAHGPCSASSHRRSARFRARADSGLDKFADVSEQTHRVCVRGRQEDPQRCRGDAGLKPASSRAIGHRRGGRR